MSVGVSFTLTSLMMCCDVATLTALLTSLELLQASGGMTPTCLILGCVSMGGLVLLQGVILGLLVRCLHFMKVADASLQRLGLDAASLYSIMLRMGLVRVNNPFEGRTHGATLASRSSAVMPLSSSTPVQLLQQPPSHSYSPVPRLDDDDEEDQKRHQLKPSAGRGPGGMSEAGAAALARLGGRNGGQKQLERGRGGGGGK